MNLLQHDFCPWANRYVYWLRYPLSQLAITAVTAFSIGWWAVPQGFVAFFGLLAVISLGLIWPFVALRLISSTLEFSAERTSERGTVDVILKVHNRWPWPMWGLLVEGGFCRDEPPQNHTMDRNVESGLACIPGWSLVEYRWEFTPNCRGNYPFAPPQLGTEFPFGLWRCRQPINVRSHLRVWPQVYSVGMPQLLRGVPQPLSVAMRSHGGNEGETIGTRDFRRGDSFRSVHWAQTARHDRLIVREHQVSKASSMSVVIDADPTTDRMRGPWSTSEWILRVGASVIHASLQSGWRVKCQVGKLELDSIRQGWKEIADALACLDLSQNTLDSLPIPTLGYRCLITSLARLNSDDSSLLRSRFDVVLVVDLLTPERAVLGLKDYAELTAAELPYLGRERNVLMIRYLEDIPGCLERSSRQHETVS